MPGPPPPPPPMGNMGPPPPPMANFNNNNVKKPSASSGMDMRGALLSQIQKGTQLKKVTTVDKSKPLAGRIADSSNSSSPTKSSRVGSTKSSPDSATSSPIRQGGFTSLTDELQHKLTLKKNKNSPLREAKSIVEPKESSPPSVTSSSKPSFVNEIKSKQSVISPQHQLQSSSVSTHVVSDAIPNKSSLFNNNINNNNTIITNNNNIISNNNNNSSYDNKSQPSAPKINHGKPNLAPKPPPQLSLPVNNNSNNNNNSSSNSLNDVNRKTVARHQSMKSPRSPPIGIAPTGPFNNDNHFGTMRNPSSQNKIQEALNLQVVQKPVAQRPTNKPPPPPVPNRNLGTNLTQSHAKSTTALNNTNSDQNLSAPRRIPNSGSSNNISNMERERNVDTIDSTAPPLPPHRMSSAQKLQQHNQLQQSVNSQVPPEVPRRHSSMRQSIENGGHNKYPSPNPNQPPAPRLVVDLEARYSLLFHSVSEFPSPKPFINVEKSYPSKAVRPANGF